MNQEKLNISIKEYLKQIKKVGDIEAINERKERKEYYQSWSKEKIINMTEDELKQAENDIQKLTDTSVEEIDKILANKEKEVMSV